MTVIPRRLVRYQIPSLVSGMLSDLDRLVSALPLNEFGANSNSGSSEGTFLVDIEELPDSYVVTADLPGTSKDQIQVEIVGRQLKIAARGSVDHSSSHMDDAHKDNRHFILRERIKDGFTRVRSITLPASGKDVHASFIDGVLTVTISKESQEVARKIEVN